MYTIKKVESRAEAVALFEKEENRVFLSPHPWQDERPNGINPVTCALATHSDDRFIVVMRSYETDLRREVFENWGPVWTDSCMEFFFSPCPEKTLEYYNMEISATGYLRFDYGINRYNRQRGNLDVSNYAVEVEVTDTYWQLVFEVPYSVVREKAPTFEGTSGDIIHMNFYKCADDAPKPHWLMWNVFDKKVIPNLDYHRPEGFGKATLE